MLCAISGEAPQVPVASRKSGNVFERRLIEAYISENGKDPVNGEELTADDLIDLKSARIVRPRPPTLTSIPSLLSVFQNEWDALALETYTLKQQLAQTRQELSTAIYQHDAAVRVIARLTRERDEARDALQTFHVGGGAREVDEMQVDNQGLPAEIEESISATQERLSKTRRKRAVPEDWATAEVIQAFKPIDTTEPMCPGSRALAVDQQGALTLMGGADGIARAYSVEQRQVVQALKCGRPITDALWAGPRPVVSNSSGSVKVFERDTQLADFHSHAGSATAVTLHPSGDILASVGVDKSYVLYDLKSLKEVTQVFAESEIQCAEFHPDGHLLAAGCYDGEAKMFDVKTGQILGTFDCGGPVQALSFSENGTWLATAVTDQLSVKIWDLRKMESIKVLDIGSRVESIKWDYTGQFLAIAGPDCVAVEQYSKGSKAWSEPLRKAISAARVEWGPNARSLITLSSDGVVNVLSSA